MKIVQQAVKLDIKNLDCGTNSSSSSSSKHGSHLPNTVRCIISGSSNSGKTNIAFNLLFHPNGLRFQNVYVFSKSLFQPKYVMLGNVFNALSEIEYFTFSENDEVPSPTDISPNSVMLFDDVACERQHNIRKYFAMGRHSGVDTLYLCQTYSLVPKQLVRDNANFLILFKQDDLNLRHVYNDHVNTDMTFISVLLVEECSIIQ
ncbi:MAG: ATPase/DNA packaging protein [Candidatus Karelsulcia muelleri]